MSHVWRATCPDGQIYPVKCRLLAEGLGLKVHGDDSLGTEFEAGLFIEPNLKAIVYNDHIREIGRKNFSIAHELGHYSVHTHIKEIRCSIKDLHDMAPHPKNIEQEANLFAATLLMPADDFRAHIDRHIPTLSTVSELADRYETSLTATCIRLVHLSAKTPLAMVRVAGNKVAGWTRSEEMRWTGFWLETHQELPSNALFHDLNGRTVESDMWLNKKNAKRWELTQSGIYMPYYDQTLILVHAERAIADDDWDESHPTRVS